MNKEEQRTFMEKIEKKAEARYQATQHLTALMLIISNNETKAETVPDKELFTLADWIDNKF